MYKPSFHPVRFPGTEKGNKFYPLPPDYPELTEAGQRIARVNAVFLQETPRDLVHAWRFFRETYLFPLPSGVWYSNTRYPSPPAHYSFVHDVGAHPRNVFVFTRSFAKTTLIDELNLLWAYTRPYKKVLIIKAMDEFIEDSMLKYMTQIQENNLLNDDFSFLYPEGLKSKRGDGVWNKHKMFLANGFLIQGRSVMSKLPGLRPWMIWMDDAEWDAKMRISPTLLSQNLEKMVVHDIVPMLDEGAALNLVGTLHSRKFFLYRAATVTEDEDPRYTFYNRVVMGATMNGKPVWGEKFSPERLEQLKVELGPAAFAAQIMNDPQSEHERCLYLHHVLGYYEVRDKDEEFEKDPLHSKATLVSSVKVEDAVDFEDVERSAYRVVKKPFGEYVQSMIRILVADPIKNPSVNSDFACVMVYGISNDQDFPDTWWPLDLRLGRVKETVFIEWIWELGEKWRVQHAGIESIGTQHKIVERVRGDFADRALRTGWQPRIVPIRYEGEFRNQGKAARISRLGWRMDCHRYKFPRDFLYDQPWSELHYQIENFTEDLRLLQNDDAVDAAVMPAFMAPSMLIDGEAKGIQLLKQGQLYYPNGMPIMGGLNANQIPKEAADVLQQKRFDYLEKLRERAKKSRGKMKIIGPST